MAGWDTAVEFKRSAGPFTHTSSKSYPSTADALSNISFAAGHSSQSSLAMPTDCAP